MDEYKVKLSDFEGPMELLLELIEKEKLKISEISLASVCDQFLEYTKHFEELEPKHLANFLSIASKLILIKSKSLLPFLELTKEEEDDISELQGRLEEFQKIRKGAEIIRKLEDGMRISYERQSGLKGIRAFLPPKNISKDMLFEIFSGVKKNIFEEPKLEEKKIEAIVSFEEKMSEIKQRIMNVKNGYFHHVAADNTSKANTILGFLVVLELVRRRFLIVDQEDNFSDIHLKVISG